MVRPMAASVTKLRIVTPWEVVKFEGDVKRFYHVDLHDFEQSLRSQWVVDDDKVLKISI